MTYAAIAKTLSVSKPRAIIAVRYYEDHKYEVHEYGTLAALREIV